MASFDAVVIGGGPAGLAAASAAARAGLTVLLADVRQPPIDKLCGEGLMPDGLAALRTLGVEASELAGAVFEGIRFSEGGCSFAGLFRGERGRGVRRTVLQVALVEAAAKHGVTMRWGCRAERVDAGRVRVGTELVRCRWVIGADGQRSLVRQRAGLSGGPAGLRKRERLAAGRHYAVAPWSGCVEVYWSGRTQAYVTPVGPAEVGVAFISKDPGVRADDCLQLFPALRERLEGAEVVSRTQGGTALTLRLPQVVRGDVALVGEASGSVDAITGEGMTLVFRQALALGEALAVGDLRGYAREHRVIQRRALLMSRLLLSLSEFPRWRARVFRAFAEEPLVFENLLAMLMGAPLKMFGHGGCGSLCRELLRA